MVSYFTIDTQTAKKDNHGRHKSTNAGFPFKVLRSSHLKHGLSFFFFLQYILRPSLHFQTTNFTLPERLRHIKHFANHNSCIHLVKPFIVEAPIFDLTDKEYQYVEIEY